MAFDTTSKELHFKDKTGHDNAVIIDKYPDLCPVCDHGIDAKGIDAYGKTDMFRDGHYIQAVFQCPRENCQAIFITFYTSASYGPRNFNEYVFLRNCYVPAYFEPEKFDEEIESFSPDFIKIFTQAKMADSMGLHLICGAGYRKSLEFLIKDYVNFTKPKKKQIVSDHSLGWLIVNEVDSEKVKFTAGLAKDVGNDETHYEKKIEELSLEDLRKLIKLTTNWISDELTMRGYLQKVDQNKETANKTQE